MFPALWTSFPCEQKPKVTNKTKQSNHSNGDIQQSIRQRMIGVERQEGTSLDRKPFLGVDT